MDECKTEEEPSLDDLGETPVEEMVGFIKRQRIDSGLTGFRHSLVLGLFLV